MFQTMLCTVKNEMNNIVIVAHCKVWYTILLPESSDHHHHSTQSNDNRRRLFATPGEKKYKPTNHPAKKAMWDVQCQ